MPRNAQEGTRETVREVGVGCRPGVVPLPRRVLVVDDDPSIRRALARELQREFEVCLADGYATAIQLLDGDAGFFAVVSDLMMGPGANGADLLTEVRRRSPRSARLLVSGTVTEGQATCVVEDGVAHEFIGKPWQSGEVLAAIQRWADRPSSEADPASLHRPTSPSLKK